MKAITILQPYASLIACGVKQYETRSWATNYRGPIAIHAGKKQYPVIDINIATLAVEKLTGEPYDHRPLGDSPKRYIDQCLPYGAIVAFADLVDCLRTMGNEQFNVQKTKYPNEMFGVEDGDKAFGDFTYGRFAWELVNVKVPPSPIYCSGKQGLWDCSAEISAAYRNPNQTAEMKDFLRQYVKTGSEV